MKILYINRDVGIAKNGAKQVMDRNYRALTYIVGENNIKKYILPKTNLKNVFTSILYLGNYGMSKRHEAEIIDELKSYQPDFVFLESSMFGSLLKKIKNIHGKTIIFAHNVDTELSRQEIKNRKWGIGLIKYLFVRYNEKKSLKYADRLICLNERDSDGLYSLFGRKADIILPITFPVKLFDVPKSANNSNYYLFVGSDFFPNVEGIKWFIQNVASYINAEIRVVGKCCYNQDIRTLNHPSNVKFIGYADDLDEEYNNAIGVIAPIFKGSGMKTKTIEAMSYGKSIFGTSEAFAGINLDYSLIGGLCNTAEEFIKSLNGTNIQRFNDYSFNIFKKEFSDEYFTESLSRFLLNC